MKSHESKPSPHLDKALALIKKQPRGAMDISRLLVVTLYTSGRIISELIAHGKILAIGTAAQAGRSDLNRNAVIYGVAGTPVFPQNEKRGAIRRQQRQERRPRNTASSGVAAGHRYVAPVKSPIPMLTKEHRDRAALAMLAR